MDDDPEARRTRLEEGRTTYSRVLGSCESACALAFFGGQVRRVESYDVTRDYGYYSYSEESQGDEGKLLGVHQFNIEVELSPEVADAALSIGMETSQFLQALIVGYLNVMGIDPRVAQIAASTPADEMHYLTE